MRTYQTSELASIVGVHPNTVRLYEKLELIPKALRQKNGYRILLISIWNSSTWHVWRFKLMCCKMG